MTKTYETYKDSGVAWIGEIPSGWEIRKGKTIFEQSKTKGNTIPILLAATQKCGMIPQSQLEGVVQVNENADMQSFKTVHKNDYVISLRSFQGGFEMSDYEGVCSPAYTVFRSRNKINNQYYKRLFKVKPFIDKINSFYQGIREGKQIHFEEFAKMDLPVPNIAEQTAIATFLDTKCSEIDSLISLQEEMISELQAYKQSVITEAVTKGLNPNAKLKDSGVEWIGEIPEGWDICQLKHIIDGRLQYGANESGILFDERLPRYVRITDIYNNTIREDIQKQSLTEKQAEGFILKNNDILFARSGGTVGKTFIYRQSYGRCAFAGYLIKASVKDNNSADFIYYYTQSSSYDEWKNRIFIQATIQNIGADKYSIMEIPIPPPSEQQTIASYLDEKTSQIDSLIAIKREKIEELKDYKKSIIYEYVTGKKRV